MRPLLVAWATGIALWGLPSVVVAPPCGVAVPVPLAADSVGIVVRSLLTQPDGAVRHIAADRLGRLPFEALEQRHPRGGGAAGKDSRQALTSALDDPDEAVRVAAACALGRIGDARALPGLDRRGATGTTRIRAAAGWAASQIRARGAPSLLIRNTTVVDGTGGPPRPNVSVLIEGGWITRIGNTEDLGAPPATRILDGGGRWLVPGLWDMHVHLGKAGGTALSLLVSAGVTSVRDMGGDYSALTELRDRIRSGAVIGPRLVLAGPMLEGPATLARFAKLQTLEPVERTRVLVATPADANRIVDSLVALGVDLIKIRDVSDLDTYRAAVHRARQRGVPVAGHAPYAMPPREGLGIGLTTMEHASYPYPLDTLASEREELLRILRRARTAITPTMVAWSSYLMDRDSLAAFVEEQGPADPRRLLLTDSLVQEWRFDLRSSKAPSEESLRGWCSFLAQTVKDLRAMRQAGVPILLGTDLGVLGLLPGWSLHDELEFLVGNGVLSSAEAIHAVTGLAAQYAGVADEVGTIAVGQRADLLLVNADPLENVRALRRLSLMVLDGRVLDAPALAGLRAGVPLDYRGHALFSQVTEAGCPVMPGATGSRY